MAMDNLGKDFGHLDPTSPSANRAELSSVVSPLDELKSLESFVTRLRLAGIFTFQWIAFNFRRKEADESRPSCLGLTPSHWAGIDRPRMSQVIQFSTLLALGRSLHRLPGIRLNSIDKGATI